MSAQSILSIKNLSFYLARLRIINDFSLSLKKGEIITLFGPSGCGKTTLLKIIGGILESDFGALEIFTKRVSFIFQEHYLFPSISALENIALVMKSPDKVRILQELSSVGLSPKDALKYPDELSGGMRARVSFMRAMMYEGELLLLDEPFSGLDFKMREILMKKIIEKVESNALGAILVTHDAYEACLLSHKIYFLSQKQMQIEKILEIDTPFKARNEAFISALMKNEFKGRMYFD